MTRTVSQLAPWVGSDVGIVPDIIEMIGEHRAFWQIFAGGLSVLVAKKPCRKEIAVDLHPMIINLARTLTDPTATLALKSRLATTLFCQDTLDAAGQVLAERKETVTAGLTEPHWFCADTAYWSFVRWWIGKGGVAGGPREGEISIRFDSKGGDMGSRFRTAVNSLDWFCDRFQRVEFHCRDGFDAFRKIEDRDGTVIYADPVFVDKEHLYSYTFRGRSKAAALWSTDEGKSDHERLAEEAHRFKHTRVVIRYYDHPEVRRLYPGWEIRDCSRTKQQSHEAGRKGDKAPDILLRNR